MQLFAALWNLTHQAPLSMQFSRQEYWSGLPCPSPGHLPNPRIEPRSPALRTDSLPSKPPGKPGMSNDEFIGGFLGQMTCLGKLASHQLIGGINWWIGSGIWRWSEHNGVETRAFWSIWTAGCRWGAVAGECMEETSGRDQIGTIRTEGRNRGDTNQSGRKTCVLCSNCVKSTEDQNISGLLIGFFNGAICIQ